MNENKYYTPSIEEFRVGFEYEYVDGDSNDWDKNVVADKYELAETITNLFLEFRVKYLDQEDIESLGFEYYGEDLGWITFIKNDRYKDEPRKTTLTYNPESKDIGITTRRLGMLDASVEYLIIKNKSELAWLLKQLGI